MSGPVVWVEGVIGAGKTTLTRHVAEALGLRAVFEPVDDNPMLAKFYDDPETWAFPMQMWLMAKRHAMQQLCAWEARHGEFAGAIVDRGLPGDRVFCKMLAADGKMPAQCWQVYEYFYDVMALNLPVPSLLVFLDVEAETAYERMRGRGREAEAGVPLEYLQRLRAGYLDLLVEIESGVHGWARGMQVMRVPWNAPGQDPGPIVDEIRHRCRL